VADLDFDLTVARDESGACRLTLRGELDLATTPRLEDALAEADGNVLLDLRGLTFMDSTGVRVLLEAAEGYRRRLRVIAPDDGDVRVTIEETGIAPLLPLVDPGAGEQR
jgi:anti-sigma B factor antagonist